MNQPAADSIRTVVPAARDGARRLPWLDRLTLGTLVVAVVMVTIPRLRAMAMHANERDARGILAWLGEELAALPSTSVPSDLESLVACLPIAARRLTDARVLETGELAHHGYVFRCTRDGTGGPRLLAWPFQAGRTGEQAYVWDPGGLWVHRNRARSWSGVEGALPADVEPSRSPDWSLLGPE